MSIIPEVVLFIAVYSSVDMLCANGFQGIDGNELCLRVGEGEEAGKLVAYRTDRTPFEMHTVCRNVSRDSFVSKTDTVSPLSFGFFFSSFKRKFLPSPW